MNKDIVILGSKGMLGQMVKKYFTLKGAAVTYCDQRFTYTNRTEYTAYLRSLRNVVVFNCIGKIKQKTDNINDFLQSNAILPAQLRNCLYEDVILIQPSTDCVFKGDKGDPYIVDDITDVTDDYGWSKCLGEVVLIGRPNTLIPRVSIIGPDENSEGKGLMTWVMSNRSGKTIKGFTNHLWNGITTLEWCKQVEQFLIQRSQFDFCLLQYGTTEHYSKYEMLLLFNDVFNLGLHIEPLTTPLSIDRRLAPDIICKSLESQLAELRSF
jgi:dTDP-4-dehydrorhamnose reductase